MSYKILLVDDSASIRSSLRTYIEQNTGWQICGEAENGKVALKKVRELAPDLIILDLSMPVMDGLETATNLARIAPKIPILLFTMHASEEIQRVAEAFGIREVIAKSETAKLLALLRAHEATL